MTNNVAVGDSISYHDMFGICDFVDTQYFVIKLASDYTTKAPVRVCVPWDSQYTVHPDGK